MFRKVVATSLLLGLTVIGSNESGTAAPPGKPIGTHPTSLFKDTDTRLDVNQLEMFVYNDGNFAYDNANYLGKTDGLYFPRGTKKTVIYAAGFWVGAKVAGEPRVAVAEYSSEYVPGVMAGGTFMPDNAQFKVYKIQRGDSPQSNPDYANWPTWQGAPVDDEGAPLLLGDQVTWSVFTDADPNAHVNHSGSTPPLGIEVQHAAYGFARGDALGNAYFLKYTIINKGANLLEDTYIAIWVDPDLGSASDDLVGCDTIRAMGYCYNDGDDSDYGAKPPAVGMDLLQGPIVPATPLDIAYVSGERRRGFRNLGMTSFIGFASGADPMNANETYAYMRGLIRDSLTFASVPMVNPVTGQVTTFALSGDPVTSSGWVDTAAGDRRMLLSSGPFTMASGDTQEVVAAVMVGQGDDAVSSITALRAVNAAVQKTHGPLCGDMEMNGVVGIFDVLMLLNYVFGDELTPPTFWMADVDCNLKLNLSDCVYLIDYVFLGGNEPCSAYQ